MIHVCYHTFLSDNSACCHLAVSPFFGGAAPINICLCILVQLTCTLGLLRSILSILTWVSVLLLDVFETCCYAWLPLKHISQQHHNINVTNKLYIFMICASFEDIQKHDTNTDIMSHILPFLLGFPSFQRESRANWTIPAPWPGEAVKQHVSRLSTGAETAKKWRCLVRGWFMEPMSDHFMAGGTVWKWETHVTSCVGKMRKLILIQYSSGNSW